MLLSGFRKPLQQPSQSSHNGAIVSPSRRFFIVAGEVSGDQHGATLMAAMHRMDPSIRFAGIGGASMKEMGMDCLYHSEDMALVGFSEVLKHVPFLIKALRRTIRFIQTWDPERVILIDYPGFNLRLARHIHQQGIPVTYYISPQLWAWREGRIHIIRKYVDQLLVIFPFEVDWYRSKGVTARFVGHPLLEEAAPSLSREEYLSSQGLNPDQPILTLFPGSRPQELDRHLQIFCEAAHLLRRELPHLQVMLGLARGLTQEMISLELRRHMVIEGTHPRLALRFSDAAIVASGSATLEGAVWGVPMAVVYRVSPLSWWLGRRLVRLSHAAMVNILSGEEVVPEFLQERAQASLIVEAILPYFLDKERREALLAKLDGIRRSLMSPATEGKNKSLADVGFGLTKQGASYLAARAILSG
jgi:lipid-A-disaccharide synthase